MAAVFGCLTLAALTPELFDFPYLSDGLKLMFIGVSMWVGYSGYKKVKNDTH